MEEKLNVRLGNPVVMFFWSSAMFLTGITVGVYWHPSRTHSIAIAFAAGVFTMLHELVCCFVWCSISACGSVGAWANSRKRANNSAKSG